MADITVCGVCKTYGANTVLQNFDCVIKEKSRTAFMAESGRGKTTLAGIIAGTIKADSGSVTGVPCKIAYVFQENRLCESFDAIMNLRLVTDKSDSELTAVLNALGVTETRKRVSQMSGGMKRRVAIARALVYDAELYIFDEAFRELDDVTKASVMEYVKRRTDGKTVIIVTHDLTEAEFFGADIINIRRNNK